MPPDQPEQPPPTLPHSEIPERQDTEPNLPAVPTAKEIAAEWTIAIGNMFADQLAPHTRSIDAMRADIGLVRGEVQAMRRELTEIRRGNDQRDERIEELERQAADHEKRLAALEKTLPPLAAE